MVTEERCCLAPFPSQGRLLQGATCGRASGHIGPHCSRQLSEQPVIWSQDGTRLVTKDGSFLVSTAELTDPDGTLWT